ncbi:MAG: pilus assembly protein TadG-related protein [Sinobacteraceae bacterium]|nr:pilus assembly protein TadG-related protein [Nevskiaceae bacterium]
MKLRSIHRRTPSGLTRQRGAAAVFVAVALIALLTAVLLAINIGQLYYAQRDLQKQAVLAALAGVQRAGNCGNAGAAGTEAQVAAAANASLAANPSSGFLYSTPPALASINGADAAEVGWVNSTSGGALRDENGNVLTDKYGNPIVAPNDGKKHFFALNDNDPHINAVRVNMTAVSSQFLFSGFFRNTPLRASATAMQQALGAFSIGSTLVSLDTAQSMLNPLLSALLGSSVNLSAVDYQGLAQTRVSLANLEVAAGVNDLSGLLALNTNAAALQQIFAAAVQQVNPAVANTITGLTLGSTQASSSTPLASLLGNIATALNPAVTDAAAQVPFVNALDLLMALGQAAAGTSQPYRIQLPVSVNIPGVTAAYAFVGIQQPMQPSSLGPVGTTQHTAQVMLNLRLQVDPTAVTNLLKTLLLGLVSIDASINLGIDLQVAPATGTLTSVVCPTAATPSPSATVDVATDVSTLSVGSYTGNPSTDPPLDPSGGTLLSVNATVQVLLLKLPLSVTGTTSGPVNGTLGSGSGTGGPFTIYSPPQPIPNSHALYWDACNNIVGANPTDCGATTDPNNPAAPIGSADIASGIRGLITSLVSNTQINVNVFGNPLLNAILNTLLGAVSTILSTLNSTLLTPVTGLVDTLLDPLLQALGVQVGSGTILMNAVETGQPVIATTALPGS